jgi:CheY-like chemotaxis protein
VAALTAVAREKPAAVIIHRSMDLDGLTLVRRFRKLMPATPIILVSGRESCAGAIEAGANAVLNYDAWLRIGLVVEEVLAPHNGKAHPASVNQQRVTNDQ